MDASKHVPTPDRRRSGRFMVQRPLRLSWMEDGVAHSEYAMTSVVSRYGCCVQCGQVLPPGHIVTLTADEQTIQGRVIYSLEHSAQDHVEVAFSFEEDASKFWGMTF